MSDFKAKMHQIRFRLGLRRTPLGELTALPRPQAPFKGPTSKRRGREGGEGGEGRGKEKGKGREGKGGESVPIALILQFDHWNCTSCIVINHLSFTPYFKLTNNIVTWIFVVLLPSFTLYCKIRSRDLTTPTLRHFTCNLSCNG